MIVFVQSELGISQDWLVRCQVYLEVLSFVYDRSLKSKIQSQLILVIIQLRVHGKVLLKQLTVYQGSKDNVVRLIVLHPHGITHLHRRNNIA